MPAIRTNPCASKRRFHRSTCIVFNQPYQFYWEFLGISRAISCVQKLFTRIWAPKLRSLAASSGFFGIPSSPRSLNSVHNEVNNIQMKPTCGCGSHHVQWPCSNTSARRANPFLAGCVGTPCWFVILILHWLMGADFATQPRHTFLFMAAFLKYSTAPGSPRDWSSRPNSIIASLKVASRLVNAFLPTCKSAARKTEQCCTHGESFAWELPRKRWKHVDLIWS